MALPLQARRMFRNILNLKRNPPNPPFIIVVFEKQREGGGEVPGTPPPPSPFPPFPPRQTQRMGTSAWHGVATALPTATLAAMDSEGSARGESSPLRPTGGDTRHIPPAGHYPPK
ncbi:hypothetical protein EYF80_038659 [Liparis tanakae]|uniref:Uncharacterized protein n=1 Tax=Liparis tanakae TaxID=230148 RepID=A0A4Z2GC51_9TELE|nr:hypothetical protein EYF80_038659 [Liparis tanakae]